MTRINSIYVTQTSSVVFACKAATLAPEILDSVGPSPHVRLCAFKTATLRPELQVSMSARPHLWICASKTACLLLDLIVSMGSRTHLWIFANKTACLAPKYKSLWVPDLTCGLVNAK